MLDYDNNHDNLYDNHDLIMIIIMIVIVIIVIILTGQCCLPLVPLPTFDRVQDEV